MTGIDEVTEPNNHTPVLGPFSLKLDWEAQRKIFSAGDLIIRSKHKGFQYKITVQNNQTIVIIRYFIDYGLIN
jgi:hypothetical protein